MGLGGGIAFFFSFLWLGDGISRCFLPFLPGIDGQGCKQLETKSIKQNKALIFKYFIDGTDFTTKKQCDIKSTKETLQIKKQAIE